MISIVRFIEGTFIPSREGATNHFLNFCRKVIDKEIDLKVFHCFRGWSEIEKMKQEPYRIYLFHPDTYYKNIDLLCSILNEEDVKILIMNDAETVYYHGSEIKKRLPFIKIYFEIHDVETTLKDMIGEEINETIKIEKEALKIADFYTCFTQKDNQELLSLGAREKDLHLIPSGVDINEVKYHGPSLDKKVLFLGNNYYKPNSLAIKDISEISERINYEILIGGNTPPELNRLNNITFLGYIEDINTLLKKGTIAIAPIKIGSGIRVKILNYMASGLPVITTSKGIEGIKAGRGVIISDNLEDYPKIINSLMKDDMMLEVMGRENREIIKEHYSWDIISDKLVKLFKNYVT